MIYNDWTSSFEDLYIEDNSFTDHDFIIQSLAIEIIKFSDNITPTVVDDLFARSHHSYKLFSKSNFFVPGIQSLSLHPTLFQEE